MYLRTLALHGFKSFAHPVQVELSPGLNVVVGPNGAGKSNLLDALRWVLGERRGGHHVLFHGSTKYRPIGMASVELFFEPPLRVEKRAFASGEVEYFFQGRKVRFGDLRQEFAKIGLSLHRLEVGFVTNRDLHALADLSPLERLRWLEEASGTLEMRARLAELSRLLQKVIEKRGRFQERLREIAFQRARVAEWARKEEEYLHREKRWKDARKTYYTRLLEKLREDFVRLSEEELLCDQKLRDLSYEQSLLALDVDKQNLFALRKDVFSLRRQVEEARQCVTEKERELHHLLTEMRVGKRTLLALEIRAKSLLEKLDCLEKERKSFQALPGDSPRLEKAERVVLHFCERKRAELRALQDRERQFWEETVRLEVALRSIEQDLERLLARREELTKEIEDLERLCADLLRQKEECENEWRTLEEEKERVQYSLVKTKEALVRVRNALEKVESQGVSGAVFEEIHSSLLEREWPNRAIYAFFGFLKGIQVLEEGSIPGDTGKWMVFRISLPPCSSEWALERREVLLLRLQRGIELQKNYVALDGSVVVLKGGFFLFPRKVVPGARFVRSWKKRESRFACKVQELEEALWRISHRIEEIGRQKREIELRTVRWQERLRQKNETRCEIEQKIAFLSAERLRLRECLAGSTRRAQNFAEEANTLQKVIFHVERVLKKIEEKKQQREAKKRRYERFLWEMQKTREEALSVIASARESVRTLQSLEKQIAQCGRELGEFLCEGAAKEALLRDREEQARLLEKSIEAKFQKEKALEHQKEKWIKERERLRLAKERLRVDIERTEGTLTTLEGAVCLEFQTMDLDDLRKYIEKEEQVLLNAPVRRGAIEEYEELKSREEGLTKQDTFFGELIALASSECRNLERSIHRQFLSFLSEVKGAFSRYFQQIFRGGQATLVVRDDGAHLEVEIPGKKKQSIALLSSGERTLVALCFLCACFEAGGAQMCFFDEIDANLDHANSVLLAQVLREFASKRQVVVVTHKREVMEVADRILGVTMSEPGVSQVLLCEGF